MQAIYKNFAFCVLGSKQGHLCMDLLRPVYGRQTYLHVEGINNLPTYGPAPIPLSQVNDLVINEIEL